MQHVALQAVSDYIKSVAVFNTTTSEYGKKSIDMCTLFVKILVA